MQVLLRINEQTNKVDMWAAGVLMVSLLTGRVPFFDGGVDDQTALAELELLCGAHCSHFPSLAAMDVVSSRAERRTEHALAN